MNTFVRILLMLVTLSAGFVICYAMVSKYGRRSMGDRVSRYVLVILMAVGVAGYFRFGQMHSYGEFGRHAYHYHDYFHYFFGAKYVKELGYFGLYDFTALAFSELHEEGTKVPEIKDLRSLRSFWRSVPYDVGVERARNEVERRFSKDRWLEFKKDVKNYLDLGWYNIYWEGLLFDAGFNPPPTWAVLGSPLANMFSVSKTSVEWLPWIDYILVFGVATFFILRCFGVYPALLYVLVFSVSWFNSMDWTGGSFFRLPELAAMAIGICMLQKNRYTWAGICLGLATAMRIFPVFFVLGGGLALFAGRKRSPQGLKPFFEFCISSVATLALLLGLSLVLFGPSLWQEFLAKMETHHHVLFVNHIGFKKMAVFSHSIGNQDFQWGAGLSRMESWQDMLMASYDHKMVLFTGIQCVSVCLAVMAAWKLTPPAAAMLVGGVLLFFLETPANYYYAFLAVFPAVFYSLEKENGYAIFRMACLFGLLTAVPLTLFKTRDNIIYNGYMNWLVGVFYLVVVGSYLLEQRRKSVRVDSPDS